MNIDFHYTLYVVLFFVLLIWFLHLRLLIFNQKLLHKLNLFNFNVKVYFRLIIVFLLTVTFNTFN